MAMFGYMTDTGTVEPLQTVEVETQGNQFIYREEMLYKFAVFCIIAEYFHTKTNKIDYEPVLPLATCLKNSLCF